MTAAPWYASGMDAVPMPPRYTLGHWAAEVRAQVPRLLRTAADATAGRAGPDRLDAATRVAVCLRLARRLGCPVCRALFPRLAAHAELGPEEVASVLADSPTALPPQAAAALAWTAAIARGAGAEPEGVPAAAALTPAQRAHLLFFVRLELLVHATGLFFLPHAWVARAAAA